MRLNGGEFLLNLLVLGTLTISSESVTITDESVIEQLTGLKNYINNERAIKPLFVKFNNGTEIVVARGEVRKIIGNTNFILYAQTKISSIEINVAFTQRVNANEDPIDDYYIANGDATLTFTNDMSISGDLEVDGILKVNEYEYDEDFTLDFGENDLSSYYAHARVSNGKLNIVIGLKHQTNAETITLGLNQTLGSITLPNEILSKLYPAFNNLLSRNGITLYTYIPSDNKTIQLLLTKTNNGIDIQSGSEQPITFTANNYEGRIEINFIL